VGANADKVIGLAAGREGIILVPAEDLKEGEEHADVHAEKGAGLACLFLSPRFNPVIDGKPIPQDKLQSAQSIPRSAGHFPARCSGVGRDRPGTQKGARKKWTGVFL